MRKAVIYNHCPGPKAEMPTLAIQSRPSQVLTHLLGYLILGLLVGACRQVVLNPVNPRDLPGRDAHLNLGNPSNATVNPANYDNYLMEKTQYALSYNRSRGTANWVSWHLSQAWRGPALRQNNFRSDPALPPGWERLYQLRL
jgi:endonuclease G, mitochondrial